MGNEVAPRPSLLGPAGKISKPPSRVYTCKLTAAIKRKSTAGLPCPAGSSCQHHRPVRTLYQWCSMKPPPCTYT